MNLLDTIIGFFLLTTITLALQQDLYRCITFLKSVYDLPQADGISTAQTDSCEQKYPTVTVCRDSKTSPFRYVFPTNRVAQTL